MPVPKRVVRRWVTTQIAVLYRSKPCGALMKVSGRANSSPQPHKVERPLMPDPSRRMPLRNTGLRVAEHMPWAAHLCLFYETKQDLLDTNAAYIKAGLDSDEYCAWAISEPITEQEALATLRRDIPNLDHRLARGQLEILPGDEWYLQGGKVDSKRITSGWREKLKFALDKGFEGLRVSGNAFWVESNHWKEFCDYEQELDESLEGQAMLVLCTYALAASRAVDLLDVARAHHFTIARRHGRWEVLATPELRQDQPAIENLGEALCALSRPFPGHELLTPRERAVLAQIVRGASSKEAARGLNVSPRTIEFHRANIMPKLGAKNVADLVRIVVGNVEDPRQAG